MALANLPESARPRPGDDTSPRYVVRADAAGATCHPWLCEGLPGAGSGLQLQLRDHRYRILHMAARLTRGGRVVRLRLDRTWTWAKQLALAFTRLRAVFA